MDTILKLILSKINTCLTGIAQISSSANDAKAGEAVEHLTRAYSCLYQIKESEEK